MRDLSMLHIRALRNADAAAARRLLLAELGGTPYAEPALAGLGFALREATGEAAGLVADRSGEVVGVAVFGEIAGAIGAGRLHYVTAAGALPDGVGRRLCEAALAELADRGARFVLAELPDDTLLTPMRELLQRCGFSEEARVPDYFSDGIALTFLRRDLSR